jgi:radical SAM superfamily enzyme YgiQ (UPF0313 family)
MSAPRVHPRGKNARVLLSSVFGPFAQDDIYGSRKNNPMELYQNQVTREQGVYSLRMFHRSFGLMLIKENIAAPCTLLDFPHLERFIDELESNTYDIVGISAILPNIGKVKKMCELVRAHQPRATIVVGGHIANKGGLADIISVDQIVKGEGVRWFRNYLGLDPDQPVKHPAVLSGFKTRILGHTLREKPGDTAAMVIPSVGCPLGCNFCSTSALFGGKGKSVNFFETGDELFAEMVRLENRLAVKSFFIMDENFLFHRKRALRLLALMEEHDKSWALNVFSSAQVLKSYTMEQLIGLGIGWVWMGLEGKQSQYAKLSGIDTRALVGDLQANGIRVLGSSIIGLEDHTPENIGSVIDHAVSHNSVFHQFMLYTPIPGTPLYAQHRQAGTLFSEAKFATADAHGQYRFNYAHKHIPAGQEEVYLLKAFKRDFQINGPSLARLQRVLLVGWQKYKHHPQARIRKRFAFEVEGLRTSYAGAVWAMRKRYRYDLKLFAELSVLLKDIYSEFGWKTRLMAPLVGRYLLATMQLEERRLSRGWTLEPDCFYEKNQAALKLDERPRSKLARELEKVQWAGGPPAPAKPVEGYR